MSVEVIGEGIDNFSTVTHPTTTETVVDTVKGLVSYLVMPFWEAEAAFQYCLLPFLPGKYGQETSKIHEYVKRFFIALFALPVMALTLPLAISSFPLTGLARIFESRNYRYLSGCAPEIQVEKPKFMHLNFCGFYGGLPYALGGTTPAHDRLGELVENIHEVDPDLVFLCESSRLLTPPLYHSLKDNYSHFFVDIGLNAFGMENALFVAARVPILSQPTYHPFTDKVEGDQRFILRGFFAVETADKWFFYTHLHSGSEEKDREVRQSQLEKIQEFIEANTGEKPCILLGDLNINRLEDPNSDYQKMLSRGFQDYFPEQHPDAFTGSDVLDYQIKKIDEEAALEVIDYILINDKGKGLTLQLGVLETYHARLDQSLSDHKGLIGV